MKETRKTYCPFCKKKKAEWYSKIGYWGNILVGHCLNCNKYFIDDYASSCDQDSNCATINDYYSITEDLYNDFIKDEIKANDIKKHIQYGTADGFKFLERIVENVD